MPSTVQNRLDVRGFQRLDRHPLASSQTFKAGDFVSLSAAGLAQIAAASNTNLAAVSGVANLVLGRATEDATPAAGDPTVLSPKSYCEFILAEPGTQFLMPLYHSTPANAYPNANLIGRKFEMKNSGGVWCVDLTATTNLAVKIVGFVADDYPGWPDVGGASYTAPSTGTTSQYAHAWVEFLGSICAMTAAGS